MESDKKIVVYRATPTSGLLCILLGIVFVAFKLAQVIDWSWWWVLAPFWMPFAIVVMLLLVMGLIALGVAIFGKD